MKSSFQGHLVSNNGCNAKFSLAKPATRGRECFVSCTRKRKGALETQRIRTYHFTLTQQKLPRTCLFLGKKYSSSLAGIAYTQATPLQMVILWLVRVCSCLRKRAWICVPYCRHRSSRESLKLNFILRSLSRTTLNISTI